MRASLLLTFILIQPCLFAQEGYKIDFKINGLKDTTVYLGFFLQEKSYVKDTATVDSHGAFTFAGSKSLPQGVYFLVLDNTSIFQLVMGHDQHFEMETSTEEYVKNMTVKGDDDNRLYFENIRFERERHKEAEPFIRIIRDSTLREEQKKTASENFNTIREKVMTYQQSIIEKYPQTVIARMLNMLRPVPIPDTPEKEDGTIDSTFQLRYYRKHYFDNFGLADEVMLRQPKVFYWEKVKTYLNRLFVQHPDSITKAIEEIVAIAKNNQDTYRYLVWNCLVNYQNPEIMGLDEVYVNVSDKYIATGEMDFWLDKKTVQNVKDYADKVRRAMIGRIAPNLMMQDEHLQPRSMYDLKNKYTILYFFKPSCGHCREETPKLVNFYNANKKKFDLEVFAVATDTAMKEMKDFIKEFKTPWPTVNGPRSYIKEHFSNLYFAETTPTIYILDEQKKIIARKLPVEQIGDFLLNYERIHRTEAGG